MRTLSLGVVAVLVAVGCSKSNEGKQDEAKPDEAKPPGPAEQKQAPPPCPAPDALNEQLAALWKVGADARVTLIGCVPGTYPEPGWFVMAWVDRGEDPDYPDESQLRRDIVAGGKLVTADEPSDVAPQERNEGLSYSELSVHDFDGDGAQEIIFHESLEYREVVSTEYVVLYRRGAKLEQALFVPIDREVSNDAWVDDEEGENVASVSCQAEVTIAGNKLVVKGKVITEGDPKELAVDAENCIDGEKTFTLEDGKFVAQ